MHAALAGERLQPLGHLSTSANARFAGLRQPACSQEVSWSAMIVITAADFHAVVKICRRLGCGWPRAGGGSAS